jgi:hypothetical protein
MAASSKSRSEWKSSSGRLIGKLLKLTGRTFCPLSEFVSDVWQPAIKVVATTTKRIDF